jgi:lipopolysaccharide export LptBFGC system permease protein LptF
MLQNKIYQNFIVEITQMFLVVLLGLTLIALTVRAVNFLDLIVDTGYPVITYFKYSFLNIFGIIIKFIPLSFLIALMVFILKHISDSEFIILWTSGVKKLEIVNLFFLCSLIVLFLYLIFSTYVTPLALNKSRQLLNNEDFNSFLPTVKSQQFSDSFKGFTFIVEKKFDKQIKNIFLHDKGNNLKNLSSNISNTSSTTIIANTGFINQKKLILFEGQIISSKKENNKNEVINFEQLSIDLNNLTTSTIKKPKLQETSTLKLINCFKKKNYNKKTKFCLEGTKNEIIPNLNRRVILPFYIPVLSLICSLLLINTKKKYFNKVSIFIYSFSLLIFTEMAVRYTGINVFVRGIFIGAPVVLLIILYTILIFNFTKETKKYE